VTQVEARILDQQQTACLVFAVFGEARPSVLDIRPPRHGLPPAEAATPFVYVEGVAPAFTQHVAMRWLGGVNIFRGAKEPRTGIYVGFRDDPYAGPGALAGTIELTSGGPAGASTTLPVLAYQEAFKFGDIGYGTAVASVLIVVGMVFGVVYVRLLRETKQ